MIKKVLFIVNPISGVGKQKTIEKLINIYIDSTIISVGIAYTQKPKHAKEITAEAVKENTDIVIAVGGDGSVNEVAGSLVNTNTALGIIPAGSGNGLARHLGIPLNIEEAVKIINKRKVVSIDTIVINGLFCAGVAGLGLDAHIAWKFAQFGKRGFLSYLKIFTKEYFKYPKNSYSLIIDGKEFTTEALLISLANSSQFGNNAYISPSADIADGMMDVCILKNFPKIILPYLTFLIFTKKIHTSKYMEIIRTKNIKISQTSDIAHIDGEAVEIGKSIRAKINPLSLKVIVP